MAIQLIEADTHIAERAHRFESALSGINARIVFLAGLVGARLDVDGEVQHILDLDNPALRLTVGSQSACQGGHANKVVHRAWHELRGLMVLRCDMVTHALGALGLGVTHQITSQVESALERKGIKHGTDGFDLHVHMDEIVKEFGTPDKASVRGDSPL